MRKFNIKTIGNHSRAVTQPVSQVIPRKTSEPEHLPLSRMGNLEMFHDHLSLKQKHLMSHIRRTQSTVKAQDSKQSWRKKSLQNDLSKATEALNQMRRELSTKKNQPKEDRKQDKLSKFIDTLQISLEQRRYEQMMKVNQPVHNPPPPVYYPVPMPFPIYNQNAELPYINQAKHRNQSEYTRSTFNSKYRNDSFYQRNTKNNAVSKTVRLKKNKRKFKKVVNCILFTLYFKDFCRKMRESRKISFNRLQSSLQSSLREITEDVRKLLKPFYSLLFTKRQVSYDIEPNQNKSMVSGKVDSIRRFIQLILQGSKKWMELASANKKYVQLLYHLCRHGNYSCTLPILTPDQLQLTCISTKFNYVSANRHLQNSAFINLFFMKILIYNILLSSSKVSPHFQDEILSNNLYVLSSVLYELAIQLQDQYMMQVPKVYKIGNYSQMSGVKESSPLVYKNALRSEGELISGLKSEEWVQKYFYFESWNAEKKLMKQIIDTFHKSMVKYHQLVSRKFL